MPGDERGDVQRDAGLLVNTTSLGMTGEPPLDLDLSRCRDRRRLSTSSMCRSKRGLLAAARKRGHPVGRRARHAAASGPARVSKPGSAHPARVTPALRAAILATLAPTS